MGYSVIDQKTQANSFLLGALKVSTTLTLVRMNEGGFGIIYSADYSGAKSGHVSGGPANIPSGNSEMIVNQDPRVDLIITNYSDTGSMVSMRIKVTVAAPVVGTKTIFDNTLGGRYSLANPWVEMAELLDSSVEE